MELDPSKYTFKEFTQLILGSEDRDWHPVAEKFRSKSMAWGYPLLHYIGGVMLIAYFGKVLVGFSHMIFGYISYMALKNGYHKGFYVSSLLYNFALPFVRILILKSYETALVNIMHSFAMLSILNSFTGSKYYFNSCGIISFFAIYINHTVVTEKLLTDYELLVKAVDLLLNNCFCFFLLYWASLNYSYFHKDFLISILWKHQQSFPSKLEKAGQERNNQLLLSLSHEIRNPLNVIFGNIDLALEKIRDIEVKKCIVDSKTSAQMLFHVFSNIFDKCKIDSNNLEYSPCPRSLWDVIEKAWVVACTQINKKNLRGNLLFDKKIPRSIVIDSHLVVKILLNILLNAIKYTEEGSIMAAVNWLPDETLTEEMYTPTKEILKIYSQKNSKFYASKMSFNSPRDGLRSEEDEIPREGNTEIEQNIRKHLDIKCIPGELESEDEDEEETNNSIFLSRYIILDGSPDEFSFKRKSLKEFSYKNLSTPKKGVLKFEIFDSGCGIKDLEHLFQPFSNVANERLGAGLGLWLAKKLCNIMGGDIRAYSREGQGSQFVFVIPVSTAPITPSATKRVLKNSPLRTIRDNEKKISVLVVDDDLFNRDLCKKLLLKCGVTEIESAINGQDAVNKVKARPKGYFNLILMDLEMPVMNGKESVKLIKEFEAESGHPSKVVIITGNCDLNEYNACMDKNGSVKADLFFRKPLFQKDFQEMIDFMRERKIVQLTKGMVSEIST